MPSFETATARIILDLGLSECFIVFTSFSTNYVIDFCDQLRLFVPQISRGYFIFKLLKIKICSCKKKRKIFNPFECDLKRDNYPELRFFRSSCCKLQNRLRCLSEATASQVGSNKKEAENCNMSSDLVAAT